MLTSSIEIEGTLEGDDGGRVLGLMELLQGRIEVRDVGLVVLAVVELHDLPADERLERAIVVGQIRQRVGLEATHAPSGGQRPGASPRRRRRRPSLLHTPWL